MAYVNSNVSRPESPYSPSISELKEVLDSIDATALIDRLRAYRPVGRRGYPLNSLWRAYVSSFVLNLPHTNALIRRLEDDLELRMLCGFSQLPHRTTFNRFITRLGDHRDLVEQCLTELTDQLAALLPGFGEKVAIDSTVVRTHSNPNRKVVSDSDASWTKKTSASGKDGEDEWYFGYKYHAIADATYDLPLIGFTTTASRSDSPTMPELLEKAEATHDWFAPSYVMADKGYDATSNYRAVLQRGAVPVIAIRNMPKGELREGIYTNDGRPTCMGMLPMDYVRGDSAKGHLYRCPAGGCHLKDRKGVLYCQDSVWEHHPDNLRVFGTVARASREWKLLYRRRQSIERVFKSLKQSRRLEDHCIRGLKRISLHATMSVMTFQATALVKLQSGSRPGETIRWQVRRVA